jgi:hypothetical protein
MTPARLQEIVRTLITSDGRGLSYKGAMLHELLQVAHRGELPRIPDDPTFSAIVADAIMGQCLLCGNRGHVTSECPQRKVRTC